ncbi:hypothetical protein Cni_G03654 [Canna indica]|uniref:WEB family protein n=1 Tax=Canna indica TaxID=4628 RepID=A0AAQ3JTZ9_9LILI|nr:hypothetical protein Cni_G03654 [Canna indica]
MAALVVSAAITSGTGGVLAVRLRMVKVEIKRVDEAGACKSPLRDKMLPSKPKSGLFESLNNKSAQGSPKVSKISRTGTTKSDAGSTSPMAKKTSPTSKQRVSSDRLVKTVDSKTTNKNSVIPDRLPRATKALSLQEKFNAVEKDLGKAKEQLALVEQEKIKVIDELNESKRLADETNEKLREATDAWKRAEDILAKEKLQADKLANAGKQATGKREEELQKELESIQNQHALDVSTLNSMTQEIQRIKLELMEVSNEKQIALKEASDAKKAVEKYAEKVDRLTEEISHLKASGNTSLDNTNREAMQMVKKLEAEASMLKLELERAKATKKKLAKMEALVDQLEIEVTDARKGESDASSLVDEWRKKTEMLKVELEEACQSEKSASDSLSSVMIQLEESKCLLEDAEYELSTLRGKIKSLEIEVAKQKSDLEESDRQLDSAQQDAANIGKTVELLKLELQNLEEEKLHSNNSEKVVASEVKELMEENNKLIDELRISKDEEETTLKAMEGLASALQTMSTEGREKEERLLRTQAEIEESQAEIEQLNIALRNTEERYEVMLDEARYEIVCLKKIIERFETEASNTSCEWDAKELSFVHTIRTLEEEISSLKVEMGKMVNLQKLANDETKEAKTDAGEIQTKLRQVESGEHSANEAAIEPKRGRLRLKEALLDRDNDHWEKVNSGKPFGKLQDCHEDYKQKEESNNGPKYNEEETMEVVDNDLASERDHEEEFIDDDLESDIDGSSNNQTDGTTVSTDDSITSPSKLHQHQKKKVALLHKFGNFLKKGN